MMVGVTTDTAWLYALAFMERKPQLAATQAVPALVKRWQELFAPVPHIWEQRLASDALDLPGFVAQVQSFEPRSDSATAWIECVQQAWAADERCLVFGDAQLGSVERFLHLVEPLIAHTILQFKDAMAQLAERYATLPFDYTHAQRLVFQPLASRLVDLLMRTCVLELNVARVQDVLPGDSAEQRFCAFIERIQDPAVRTALFAEYPVLARLTVTVLEHWLVATTEFLERLCQDWVELTEVFDLAHTDRLGSVHWLGDPHNHGRSVAILFFESSAKIVYKPRSMAIDAQIQSLLAWLNQQSLPCDFRTLALLDRPHYGWVEHVDYAGCTDQAQVERFYWRQGAYLALLYLLNATDFHAENSIAAGEYPVLIDVESLFHAETAFSQQSSFQFPFTQSVLRTAMLPQRLWSTATYEGVDYSGLGGTAGQLTPDALPSWEGTTTDSMRLVRKQQTTTAARNCPQLAGEVVDFMHYRAQITQGFVDLYALMQQEQDAWRAQLEAFGDVPIRIIPRATRTYSMLLYESCHPDMLRDALERDLLFDRLWFATQTQPHLADLIPAEQTALRRGDVPYFTTAPNSSSVWSDGIEFPAYFKQPGLATAIQRLESLSIEDCERQVWVIERSFDCVDINQKQPPAPRHAAPQTQQDVSVERLHSQALAIGERLLTLAFGAPDTLSWFDISVIGPEVWGITSLSHDLYGGSSGIALFLAYLGQQTGDARFSAAAETIVRAWITEFPLMDSPMIGGYSGWGSAIYTLTELGVLWHRDDLLDLAESWTEHVALRLADDTVFDLMGGAAGAVMVLLTLQKVRPSTALDALLLRCGQHLLDHAEPQVHGIGWRLGPDQEPLAGFSHGTAGVALALQALSDYSGQERFAQAAEQALVYERALFVPNVENWGDLRGSGTLEQPALKWAWCHGAPGIALGRAGMLELEPNPQVEAELRTAVRSTIAHGFGSNHSLCHGDLGNLEALLSAAQVLDTPELWHSFETEAAAILASIEYHGWLCGIPNGTETPGLMSGIAGIGYMLLRVAQPSQVPAVLRLQSRLALA